MSTNGQHQQHISADVDRKNRFSVSGAETPRSASQPPTINGETLFSSAAMQIYGSPGGRQGGGGAVPWPVSVSPSTGRSGHPQSMTRSSSIGVPSSLPRASSFSASAERERSYTQNTFSNAIRESQSRFPSTFEDVESEALSEAGNTDYGDERYNISPSLSHSRGRTFLPGDTRSRSQSLATTTRPVPMPIGSPLSNHGLPELGANWSRSSGINIPANGGGRASGYGGFSSGYGEIKPPGSRYGSLGGLARSPVPIHGSSPNGLRVSNDAYRNAEISNISPFVRDVTQILEDGSALRDFWGMGHGAGADSGGPPSGTTSRRHSVSIVQPRRVGFNAPDNIGQDEGHESQFGGGSRDLMIDDDELASGLTALNLNSIQPRSAQQGLPPSQPSSLPIYAPLSRNPNANSGVESLATGSFAESLSIPSGEHFPNRNVHSPSEHSGYSGGSGSPPRAGGGFEGTGSGFGSRARPSEIRTDLSPQMMHRVPSGGQQGRYIPSNNMQYGIPEGLPISVSPTYVRSGPAPNASFMQMAAGAHGGVLTSPLSPTSARSLHHPQGIPAQQYGVQAPGMGVGVGIGMGGVPPVQRRSSQSELNAPPLNDLGKGIPLHAVPSHWTLFIVEFKAGRTDLFYTSELLDIHVGDLVIVEADRGRDLGKVINDTITAAEVEAFQRQQSIQQAHQSQFHDQGYGGAPTSPDGPASHNTKKEINPKKIYAKATIQDTQVLQSKLQDEAKALALCQTKVRQKKLPMEVIDAEYQWDRRKLTFYFIAEKRIDFRELVRELFRLYKTRIWMASLQGPTSAE